MTPDPYYEMQNERTCATCGATIYSGAVCRACDRHRELAPRRPRLGVHAHGILTTAEHACASSALWGVSPEITDPYQVERTVQNVMRSHGFWDAAKMITVREIGEERGEA